MIYYFILLLNYQLVCCGTVHWNYFYQFSIEKSVGCNIGISKIKVLHNIVLPNTLIITMAPSCISCHVAKIKNLNTDTQHQSFKKPTFYFPWLSDKRNKALLAL